MSVLILFLWPKSRLNIFLSIAILFIFIFSPWFKQIAILVQQRNFYGVKQVIAIPQGHALISQSTVHGFQLFNTQDVLRGTTSYYEPAKPVIQLLQQQYPLLRTVIIGLGTGTMACQFRANDQLEMVDIDEQVIGIANNPNLFTYLHDCPVKPLIVQGDGRLILKGKGKESIDLLVIDAFSSDAIPTHLLTYEAFNLYNQKLAKNGIILAHISNRHINLLPVLTAIGRKMGWLVLHIMHPGNTKEGQFASEWTLLTPNEAFALELMRTNPQWKFVITQKTMLWTDNYSNLIPLLRLSL